MKKPQKYLILQTGEKDKRIKTKELFLTLCYLYSSTNETFSSFNASCKVDYENDALHLKFNCDQFDWMLRKIRVFYNGKMSKENAFPLGILPDEILNTIQFELSIRDMNIQFFDKSEKKFVFALVYDNFDDGAVYETRFVEKKTKQSLKNIKKAENFQTENNR